MDTNQRLASMDALRGFDMMFIMGVSSLIAAICSLFPGGSESWLAVQMSHARWDGFHFYDTIFPLFLFIAGISFPFSYAKQVSKGLSRGKIYRKIIIRFIALFCLGLIYGGFLQFHFDSFRLFSVLGRIGLAWMFAALIFINTRWPFRVVLSAIILLGYWFLCLIPAPDMPGADSLSQEGCLVGYIDRTLFPGHLLSETFDPEGLLSVLPAIVTALLGMFAGEFVRNEKWSGAKKTLWMLSAATAMLLICLIWKNWLPVNKKLWSSTFVLAAGAYSIYMFAIFYWIIDVKGWRGWIMPFQVIGMNSIAIYMIPRFINLGYARDFFFGGLLNSVPESAAHILSLIFFFGIYWLTAFFLYRHRLFFKV